MTILLATTNRGKLREIRAILEGVQVDLVTLEAFPHVAEPEETGSTFTENARLKALYYAGATGLPSVAEDSGLEIDALGGLPGVHSARWHGSDYAVKFGAIYEGLRAAGLPTSPARFVCALAYAEYGAIAYDTQATVEGEIAPAPRGSHGFGYDPIFYYPPYGRTLGEVDGAAKAAVSHRGQAFARFREFLMRRTGTPAPPAAGRPTPLPDA